jgi:hypothetical protein
VAGRRYQGFGVLTRGKRILRKESPPARSLRCASGWSWKSRHSSTLRPNRLASSPVARRFPARPTSNLLSGGIDGAIAVSPAEFSRQTGRTGRLRRRLSVTSRAFSARRERWQFFKDPVTLRPVVSQNKVAGYGPVVYAGAGGVRVSSQRQEAEEGNRRRLALAPSTSSARIPAGRL